MHAENSILKCNNLWIKTVGIRKILDQSETKFYDYPLPKDIKSLHEGCQTRSQQYTKE